MFRGKTVFLPCDDPEWSNFTRFFAQNFETLGLKKLISTSYAPDAKKEKYGILFEYAAEQNGGRPQNERGRIFVLDHDTNASGRIDLDDLEWEYLEGDGDFRSEEVCNRNSRLIVATDRGTLKKKSNFSPIFVVGLLIFSFYVVIIITIQRLL